MFTIEHTYTNSSSMGRIYIVIHFLFLPLKTEQQDDSLYYTVICPMLPVD